MITWLVPGTYLYNGAGEMWTVESGWTASGRNVRYRRSVEGEGRRVSMRLP